MKWHRHMWKQSRQWCQQCTNIAQKATNNHKRWLLRNLWFLCKLHGLGTRPSLYNMNTCDHMEIPRYPIKNISIGKIIYSKPNVTPLLRDLLSTVVIYHVTMSEVSWSKWTSDAAWKQKLSLQLRHTGPPYEQSLRIHRYLEYDQKSWACNNKHSAKENLVTAERGMRLQNGEVMNRLGGNPPMYFGAKTNTNKQTTGPLPAAVCQRNQDNDNTVP